MTTQVAMDSEVVDEWRRKIEEQRRLVKGAFRLQELFLMSNPEAEEEDDANTEDILVELHSLSNYPTTDVASSSLRKYVGAESISRRLQEMVDDWKLTVELAFEAIPPPPMESSTPTVVTGGGTPPPLSTPLCSTTTHKKRDDLLRRLYNGGRGHRVTSSTKDEEVEKKRSILKIQIKKPTAPAAVCPPPPPSASGVARRGLASVRVSAVPNKKTTTNVLDEVIKKPQVTTMMPTPPPPPVRALDDLHGRLADSADGAIFTSSSSYKARLENAKRKLHEGYEKAEMAKRARTSKLLDAKDLPPPTQSSFAKQKAKHNSSIINNAVVRRSICRPHPISKIGFSSRLGK
jgi:hypothetical protein